jgi:hypothetical protein
MATKKIKEAELPLESEYENARIQILEHELEMLSEDVHKMSQVIQTLSRALKETQQFAIRIGVSQNRIVERVQSWPFIQVHNQDDK